MRIRHFPILLLTLSGCASSAGDAAYFKAQPGQEVTVREGDSLITSKSTGTVVSIRPATHKFSDRPEFIVGIQNVSNRPVEFRLSSLVVTQIIDGKPQPLRVYGSADLITRQTFSNIGSALLAGLLAGVADANSDNGDTSRGDAIMARNRAEQESAVQEIRDLTLADRTIPAGDVYAGKLQIEAPKSNKAGARIYAITLQVGDDQHEILVYHGKPAS